MRRQQDLLSSIGRDESRLRIAHCGLRYLRLILCNGDGARKNITAMHYDFLKSIKNLFKYARWCVCLWKKKINNSIDN